MGLLSFGCILLYALNSIMIVDAINRLCYALH